MLPEIHKILYATDVGPHAREAFAYAVSLARTCGAEIVIVHAVEPLSGTVEAALNLYAPGAVTEEFRRKLHGKMVVEIRDRIRNFCESELGGVAEGAPRVSAILVPDGKPAEAVLKTAEEVGADLIVMGSHGHTVVGDMLLGSTAHKVTQKSRIPVLLVPMKEGGSRQPGP